MALVVLRMVRDDQKPAMVRWVFLEGLQSAQLDDTDTPKLLAAACCFWRAAGMHAYRLTVYDYQGERYTISYL
jgi:hypothetical protein